MKASNTIREGVLKMFEEYPDVLTVHEVCKVLRISKTTAYRLLKTGQLSSRRIGSALRVSKESLINFIRND